MRLLGTIIFVFVGASTARAEAPCRATCAAMETGPYTEFIITQRLRPYRSVHRLIRNFGEVRGSDLVDVKAQCSRRANALSWPGWDPVVGYLIDRLNVDPEDDVVIDFVEKTSC